MWRWMSRWRRWLLPRRRDRLGTYLHGRAGEEDASVRYLADVALSTPLEELEAPVWYGSGGVPPEVIDVRRGAIRSICFQPSGHSGNFLPPTGGCLELRAAVAERYAHSAGISPRNILITPGGSGALSIALRTCVNPGDRVVLFDPCSPLFVGLLRSWKARIAWVPTWVEERWCRFPRSVLERVLRKARMLVIADPVNPTGAVFHPDDREYIAWLAAAYDVLVYVDQAFAELHPQGSQVRWEEIPGITGRLLLAGSLSWSHNLSGWRVGWLVAPPLLVRVASAMQQLHATLVPTPCQLLSAACLQPIDPSERHAMFRRWQEQRQEAMDLFRRWGLETGDSGQGGFLWVSTASLGLSSRHCAELLARQYRLFVLAGEGCGPSGQNMIRLCLLQHAGHWQEALRRLKQFVNDRWGNNSSRTPPGNKLCSKGPFAPCTP